MLLSHLRACQRDVDVYVDVNVDVNAGWDDENCFLFSCLRARSDRDKKKQSERGFSFSDVENTDREKWEITISRPSIRKKFNEGFDLQKGWLSEVLH